MTKFETRMKSDEASSRFELRNLESGWERGGFVLIHEGTRRHTMGGLCVRGCAAEVARRDILYQNTKELSSNKLNYLFI